jgi:hypothetical protein
LAIVIVQRLATLNRPLTYPHAWAVAQAAVEARAFANSGFGPLKGVPYPNNPPLGPHPKGYVRWPPLPSSTLAVWFRVWGESEASIHGYALALQLSTACALYWTLCLVLGRFGASVGVIAWLTLPVSVNFSQGVFHQNVGLLFAVCAAGAYYKILHSGVQRSFWILMGSCATALALLSTWEFLFLPVGLLGAAIWNRDRQQRAAAAIYLLVAVGTVVGVLGWYSSAFPGTFVQTVGQVKYRLGFTKTTGSTDAMAMLDAWVPQENRLQALPKALKNLIWQVGPPGWIFVTLFGWSRRGQWWYRKGGDLFALFMGLMAPALVWSMVFVNHVAIHEFMALLAGPGVALAAAGCAITAYSYFRKHAPGHLVWAGMAAAVLALLIPLMRNVHSTFELRSAAAGWFRVRPGIWEPSAEVEFGRALREHVPVTGVILTPEPSAVPVYYSQRHLIGGATSKDLVNKVLPAVRQDFPDAPLYLAFSSKRRGEFASMEAVTESTSAGLVLVRLSNH